jgi:hypothetical protein
LLAKYYWGDQIKKNEMSGTCSTQEKRRGVYRVFVWKPEKKRPLGRRRRRWVYNIKLDFNIYIPYNIHI